MLLLVGPFFAGNPPVLLSVALLANNKKKRWMLTKIPRTRRSVLLTICGYASNMSLQVNNQANSLLNGKPKYSTSYVMILHLLGVSGGTRSELSED